MKYSFNDYIQNPMGKKNAVFSQREMFRSLYASKLDKILLRENNKINYSLYHSKNVYYVHMKVPSEVIEKFYYDVVIKFYTDNPALSVAPTLQNYYVKFYSNDPAFVYTYAHTFMKNELFIDELKEKMSKQAIKKSAEVRNPQDVVGYVKSLFFCYLIMKNKNLFTKSLFTLYGQKYDKKTLLKDIEDADIKIAKRQEAEIKKRTANKKEAKKEDNITRNDNLFSKNTSGAHIITTNKISKVTNKTKKIGYVKKK